MTKTISIIAPASWITQEYLDLSVAFLKQQGFKIKVSEQVTKRHGYMAGTDNERLVALYNAFEDKEVDIILCAKGGYGSSRLLSQIDFARLNHEKIFCGYSDITLLNLALLKNTQKPQIFFSPNLIDISYLNNDINHPSLSYLVKSLSNTFDLNLFSNLISQTEVIKEGKAIAPIIGGTLTILMTSLSTPYEIETDNKILFFEDTKEFVFKIERMLWQLKHANKLSKIKGLVVGKFYETPEYHIPFGLSMKEMILEFFKDINIPILYNFPLGHTDNKMPIKLNHTISIDTSKTNFGLNFSDMF